MLRFTCDLAPLYEGLFIRPSVVCCANELRMSNKVRLKIFICYCHYNYLKKSLLIKELKNLCDGRVYVTFGLCVAGGNWIWLSFCNVIFLWLVQRYIYDSLWHTEKSDYINYWFLCYGCIKNLNYRRSNILHKKMLKEWYNDDWRLKNKKKL